MSITPTAGSAAPKSSGRWVMQAPTSRPPFEPPAIASLGGVVYLCSISHSAAAMKSSKTFCLRQLRPRLVPRLAVFAAAAQVGLGIDAPHLHPDQVAHAERRRQRDVEAAVAVEQGRGPRRSGLKPFLWLRNIGIVVPSLVR